MSTITEKCTMGPTGRPCLPHHVPFPTKDTVGLIARAYLDSYYWDSYSGVHITWAASSARRVNKVVQNWRGVTLPREKYVRRKAP